MKAKSRAEAAAATGTRPSALDGVILPLPALTRAQKIQSRAARVGFDWENVEDVLHKLDEELGEFREALTEKKEEEIGEELGDIFFSLVNISRFVGINPEDALRKTISKFLSRFRYIEMAAAESGRKLSDMTLAEMDALWDEAKQRLSVRPHQAPEQAQASLEKDATT